MIQDSGFKFKIARSPEIWNLGIGHGGWNFGILEFWNRLRPLKSWNVEFPKQKSGEKLPAQSKPVRIRASIQIQIPNPKSEILN